jgi:hypothetical protein
MTYNTDAFGNGYWNSRAGGGLGVTYNTTDLLTALETFWGSGRSSITSATQGRLNTHMNYPGELTVASGIPANFGRFSIYIGSGTSTVSNSISTSSASGNARSLVSATSTARSAISGTVYMYANMTDRNFNILITNSTFTEYRFASAGYFTNNAGYNMTHEQCFATYCIGIENNVVHMAFRPNELNTTNGSSWRPLLITGGAQYSITCSSGSVSGTHQATDLWFIDQQMPNIKGKVSNLLLLKSPPAIGQLYTVSDDVDGNTSQKTFMCCSGYGADSILMRVHT